MWDLADGQSFIDYYRTPELAMETAATMFNKPLKWHERDSVLIYETDHPSIHVVQPTKPHFARLWLS
jgi:hypothetical protein